MILPGIDEEVSTFFQAEITPVDKLVISPIVSAHPLPKHGTRAK